MNYLPRSADFGLLVLRLWIGGSMLLLHGWGKVQSYSDIAKNFPDPLKIGSQTSLSLAVFAETVCALLLAFGFLTRFAALVLGINLGVAFVMVHKLDLKLGAGGSGELAFLYLGACVTLFIAGGGRFGFDNSAPARKRPRPAQD